MKAGDIALIPMAGRPYHAGHDGLIRLAAKECDKVIVFASESDRNRPGEVPISGADMKKIWSEYIEPTLPGNVEVVHGGTPVTKVYEYIDDAEQAGSQMSYVVYGDPTDVAPFSREKLMKYFPDMVERDQVTVRPVERTSTIDISGTQMRKFIADNDESSFLKHMPVEIDGKAIWNILRKNAPRVKPHKMFQVGKKRPATKKKKQQENVERLLHDYVSYIVRG